VDGVSKRNDYDYNTAGERTSLDYPGLGWRELTYAHDAFGQVTEISKNGSVFARYQHSGRFPVFRQVRTLVASQEVWIELHIDRPDQLRRAETISNKVRTGSTNGQGGTVTGSITFENDFDAAGNLLSQDVTLRPSETGLYAWDYDRLHRMTARSYPDQTAELFDLDDLSDWNSYEARDTSVTTYTDNVLNQYTAISGGANPIHDAKGNLVRNELGYGFSYDFENRLTQVFDDLDADGEYDPGSETLFAEYHYDALGRRVHVTGQPAPAVERYRYFDGPVPLVDFDATATTTRVQVFDNGTASPDEKLTIETYSETWHYLHADLETVAGVASPDGAIDEWYTYDAWGTVHSNHVTHTPCEDEECAPHVDIGNPYYFTGQRREWYSGDVPGGDPLEPLALYDYKARFYDARHGRFMERDAAEFGDSYNLYEYARSRPTVLTDPTGEFSFPSITVSAAIKAGLTALNISSAVFEAKQIVQQFRDGVAIQQILMGILIDAAFDRAGGKLFDAVFGFLGHFTSKYFKNLRKLCCFVGGTQIDTPDGPVAIECIQPGDLVVTRDQRRPNGPLTVRPVTRVFQRVAPVILWLTLGNGEVLGTTPGHLVWSNESGWVFADELTAGQTFADADGAPQSIIAIARDETPTETYNFEVAETGTYFANGVWVHNSSCLRRRMEKFGPPPPHLRNPQAHHDLPKKFKEEFDDAGLDINDPAFGRWVEGTPPGDHQRWTQALEREWTEFFEGRDRSPDEIIAKMLELRSDPRFR
jgi:RHS repeat-associated protein